MAANQTEAYLGLGGQLIEFLIDPKSVFQKDLQNDVYVHIIIYEVYYSIWQEM